MIQSMTAFAVKTIEASWGSLSCELRSVNHRYLELTFHLPDVLRSLEGVLRAKLKQSFIRGKVDCYVSFRSFEKPQLHLNTDWVNAMIEMAEHIAQQLPCSAPINPMDILSHAEALNKVHAVDVALIEHHLMALVDSAVAECVLTRQREGEDIKKCLLQRVHSIQNELSLLRHRLPELQQVHRDRLLARFAEVKCVFDPERIEQEMVIFAHKSDVSEEMDRLDAHSAEVQRILLEDQVAGRRLDFLMQEMNREANTLGSKSTDLEFTRVSVSLKVLIEQIREHIQNVV